MGDLRDAQPNPGIDPARMESMLDAAAASAYAGVVETLGEHLEAMGNADDRTNRNWRILPRNTIATALEGLVDARRRAEHAEEMIAWITEVLDLPEPVNGQMNEWADGVRLALITEGLRPGATHLSYFPEDEESNLGQAEGDLLDRRPEPLERHGAATAFCILDETTPS